MGCGVIFGGEPKTAIIDVACLGEAGSMQRSGVRPSVCPVDRQQPRRVAGLLLSVLCAADIDR